MPPERSRQNNPQGRQKSCSECAKSKRRCDLRQPACIRCSRQNLTCSYPPRLSSIQTPEEDVFFLDAAAADEELFFDIPDFTVEHAALELQEITVRAGSVDALNDLFSKTAEDDYTLARQNYVLGKQFSRSEMTSYARSRIEYAIDQLKLAPAMMVTENQTPWCHPALYEEYMPRSLQDAYATCALYIANNAKNKLFIARHVIDRAKELEETPSPTAPFEVLARAQAFILYQIIFMFPGDINYYGQAEDLLPHLEDTGLCLRRVCDNELDPIGMLSLYPSTAAQSAWKAYVFRESARRTLLAIFHIVAVCNLLQGRLISCAHSLVSENRITISAQLWGATSAFDFAVAWNANRHYVVKDLDFTNMLEAASAVDVDSFGKMMMASTMGIDDTRGWFHTHGGIM
jgi:hypothetical protein